MKHPNAANSSSTSAFHAGSAPSVGTATGVHGDREPAQIRAIALGAARELRSPLGAIRVLLEGSRKSANTVGLEFADRALDEIERAEAAAHDLVAWTLPRTLRTAKTSLGEIAASLTESLTPSHRRLTHLVVEQEATALETDGSLLVECFSRSLRQAFTASGTTGLEVMVHIHATEDTATFSFIHTGSTKASLASTDTTLSLADEILSATSTRLGGRTSIHDAEGHRCTVITLPLTGTTTSRTGSIQ